MSRSEKDLEKLEQTARQIRRHVIQMTYDAGSGHPGGSLSETDILTALYFYKMRYDPKNPEWPDRDRFVLSKGHGAPAFYAVLAEAGFFGLDELKNLRKINHLLQGHPSNETPGVEISSGSLGQGLSVANGIALAGKLDKKTYHVYVLLGDGELDEGQVWEAAMTAGHYKLDNITAIIDRNGIQQTGKTEKTKSLEPLAEKWKAFGWEVSEIDGHDIKEIMDALDEKTTGKPHVIIANTVKGKGVSFMENDHEWHGRAPNKEEYEKAMRELA
ncbi:MAG: transketolase [Candidatus Aenigmarchaeota archaeon]|nr:transketolase [Candidatus Aenigmarchaeota archaeon]